MVNLTGRNSYVGRPNLKAYKVNGKEYNSVQEMADGYGVHLRTAQTWARRGVDNDGNIIKAVQGVQSEERK